MGDVRFEVPYRQVRGAKDPASEMRRMDDGAIVAALAAASRDADPYLANVLASEAFNRIGRATAVLSHISEGVLGLDRTGRITYANPAAELLLGMKRKSLVGLSVHEVVHAIGGSPVHLDAADCPLIKAIEGPEPWSNENDLFSRSEGETFPVASTVSSVLVNGVPGGAVLVFADKTERELAGARLSEQAHVLEETARNVLRELHQRKKAEGILRGVLENAPDALLLVDSSGAVTLASGAAEKLFALTAAEIAGRPIETLLPGIETALAAAQKDPRGLSKLETSVRPEGRAQTPVEAIVGRDRPERQLPFILVVRDLSERKRAEAMHALLAKVVSSSQEGILSVAVPGRAITSWNPAAARLLGYSEEDILGETLTGLAHPDSAAEVQRALEEVARLGTPKTVHTTLVAKDGVAKAVVLSLSPLERPGGGVVGVSAFVRERREGGR